MTATAFDSAVYGGLFADEEIAAFFSDEAQIAAMLRFEAALARAEGGLGIIPEDAAAAIAATAKTLRPDPADLRPGTAASGVPVPALLSALRDALDDEAARYVHWGATSQDVIDTGLVLRLRDVVDVLDRRLAALVEALSAVARDHRRTVMAGRTRSQQATPTTFGLKVAGWLAPLSDHRRRLAELRPRLLRVQFGGASGTLAALGDRGIAVMEAVADELDLVAPPMPWHSDRTSIAEFAGWLSLVSGSLGKIGVDLVLLAQSEVGEVSIGAGGGSSTMPQKSNPVAAELLVALARSNAGLLSTLHQALVHEHERSGSAWSLEWLALPQMAVTTGAALRHAAAIVAALDIDADKMRANLDSSSGMILAEAAVFALAAHMPRPEAQKIVSSACAEAVEKDRHLMDSLAETTDAPVDWESLRDPANYLGVADEMIDRVLAAAKADEESAP